MEEKNKKHHTMRNMKGINFVLEIIVIMFLLSQRNMSIFAWVLSLMIFHQSYEFGNERIYLEIIEDYPYDDCLKPTRCKFLFKKMSKLSYKGIPKEMYVAEVIKVYSFIIYTILMAIFLFVNRHMAVKVGYIYILLYSLVTLISACIMGGKRFLARYKCFNRYNIKYLFCPDNEPYPRNVGKCQIIKVYERRKKFASVRILETGEEIKKVLIIGEMKKESAINHNLYEICNVFYIV